MFLFLDSDLIKALEIITDALELGRKVTMLTTDYESYLRDHKSQYLEELCEFLRIPSISSLSEHENDVKRAAEWVSRRMQLARIEGVRTFAAGKHPIVYGEWLHAEGKPTILVYGHFDTQPVDPVALWSNDPFEPTVKDNRVYARGASDDKGNMLIPILAVEAMLNTQGALPVNVKFLFEGQEEIFSPQLIDFVPSHDNLLSCDLILSADGGQWEEDQPALCVGLRGLCAMQIDVQGARMDVHSGRYGGTFMNPIHALAHIIQSMHSSDGKILVEGFYEDVHSLSLEERANIKKIPYSEDDYRDKLGVSELFGESGYSTYERAWVRPTLETNGIWGGYQEEGLKTVIPSTAHAKISCRLTSGQDPKKVIQLVTDHIKNHAPNSVRVNVRQLAGHGDPYLIPYDHPGNQAARVVLKELYGKEPYFARMGGTIPACGILLKALNAYTVNFAFGLKDENVHAPNEFFRLSSFELGQKAYCMLFNQLADYEL